MKYFLIFLLPILVACSTTKQLNKKWVGKTDQDVVNEFGLPKKVLSDTTNGKIYYYESLISLGNLYKKNMHPSNSNSLSLFENSKGYQPTLEITTFYFDSLNKVRFVLNKDTIDKRTIYKNKSGKAF